MYKKLFKPFFDFIASLILLMLLSPVILIITLFLAIEHKGDVFFIQERAKKGGIPFHIIKFRTLKSNGELTSLGNFLRASSLDEIPQLINILKGEMSLIGPRPLYVTYNTKYSPSQAKRLEVKPGITGLAQINGENRLSWERKFQYDSLYVQNISFKTDSYLFFQTILYLLLKVDLKSRHHMTAQEFKG